MKKLIVSYQQQRNTNGNGTVYDQQITITKEDMEAINKDINFKLAEANNKDRHTYEESKIMWYAEPLKVGKNYTKLTTANIVKENLSKLGYDTTKIKNDRNTVVKVK